MTPEANISCISTITSSGVVSQIHILVKAANNRLRLLSTSNSKFVLNVRVLHTYQPIEKKLHSLQVHLIYVM